MRVLISSVTSYLGYYLAQHFILNGHQVVGTYRSQSSKFLSLSLQDNFTPIKLSHSYSSHFPIIDGTFDLLINSTGAYSDHNVSDDDIIYANIKIASVIKELATANPHACVINLSSLSVYGDLKIELIDSSTHPSPASTYGSTKLLSEQIINESNPKAIVHVRLPVVLGNGAHRAWLPTILQQLSDNLDIKVYNPDELYNTCTTLPAIYDFICSLAANQDLAGKHTCNVSSIPDLTVTQILARLQSFVSSSSRISYVSDSTPCCSVDLSQAISLGFKPLTTSQSIDFWLHETFV